MLRDINGNTLRFDPLIVARVPTRVMYAQHSLGRYLYYFSLICHLRQCFFFITRCIYLRLTTLMLWRRTKPAQKSPEKQNKQGHCAGVHCTVAVSRYHDLSTTPVHSLAYLKFPQTKHFILIISSKLFHCISIQYKSI